jgi:hypothetical protein
MAQGVLDTLPQSLNEAVTRGTGFDVTLQISSNCRELCQQLRASQWSEGSPFLPRVSLRLRQKQRTKLWVTKYLASGAFLFLALC